jgi:hypothetical protein
MTIALEHIQPDDWAAVNRVVDVLRSLVIDTGGVGLGIRGGTSTVTWPGGSTFVHRQEHHARARQDTDPVLITDAAGGTLAHVPLYVATVSARPTFSVAAETGDLSSPAAAVVRNFLWQAIG